MDAEIGVFEILSVALNEKFIREPLRFPPNEACLMAASERNIEAR